MAAALAQLSSAYMNKGNLEAAVARQEESLFIREEIDDEEGQVISLHQLAILHRMQGDTSTSLVHSQAAEKLARKLNNHHLIAAILHEQGLIYNEMASTSGIRASQFSSSTFRQQATQRFRKSLAISRRTGNEAAAAGTLSELGKLLWATGQQHEAIAAFQEALDIYRRQDNPVGGAVAIQHLGIVHEQQGEYAAALAKYQEALALFRQYSHAADIAHTECNIARVRAKMAGQA